MFTLPTETIESEFEITHIEPSKDKEEERKYIESATEKFLAAGGQIKYPKQGECDLVLPIETKHILEE